jgi:AraC-like DNA-binding protein
MNFISTFTLEHVHSFLTLVWGLICLLMGISLVAFNIPQKETLHTYRVSVRVLSTNYLILAALVFCLFFFGMRDSTVDVIPISVLLINVTQAIIMPFVFVTLYTPVYYATKNAMRYNVIPCGILIALYIASVLFFGDPICETLPIFISRLNHPTVAIRLVFFLYYIYQMTYYTYFMKKQSKRYNEHLAQYYSETLQLKPVWAWGCFYFALLIGFMGIASSLIESIFVDSIFILIYCVFYIVLAIIYMQYKWVFLKQDSAFMEDMSSDSRLTYDIEDQQTKFDWKKVRKTIIDKKLYLQSGITVNDLAERFHTNRTSFSSALNKNEAQNFNAFINQLRIEHAKQLFLENPEMSLTEMAKECGYTEQSNFSRQFRQLCNMTPATWRENNKPE